MTTNNKNQLKMDDFKAIEKCPELTEFIVKNRVSAIRKSAIIVTIIASVVSLILGFFAGLNIAGSNASGNVIEVKVNASEQVDATAVQQTEELSK